MNWDAALAGYDRDLRTRGAAERTRRAYAVDLAASVRDQRLFSNEPV